MENSVKGTIATHTRESVYGVTKDTDGPSCSYTLPTMPEKRSTYGDTTVMHTESDSQNKQGETAEKDEPPTNNTATATEVQPTEEEATPEINTPPPSTPVQCSTSYGARPNQPEGEQRTPIRATVSAEVTPKRVPSGPGKGNLRTIEKKESKNCKIPIEPSIDLRRSSRIKDAKQTVKLGGVEYF